MYQGFETAQPVTLDPATLEERERVRHNYRVLTEISDAVKRGDAELVKRLAALIEVRPLAD
jgi:hypothetical protein